MTPSGIEPATFRFVAQHPKHVEKINKYVKQTCAPSWTNLRDYTGKHGQQNKKKHTLPCTLF